MFRPPCINWILLVPAQGQFRYPKLNDYSSSKVFQRQNLRTFVQNLVVETVVAVAKGAAAAAAAVVVALRRCLRSCVAVAAAVDAAAGNVGSVEGCWSLAAGLSLLDHLKAEIKFKLDGY